MKAGLATSVAAHALILTWGLISLSSPADFNAEVTEALPVSLVPIAETTSIQKGELKSLTPSMSVTAKLIMKHH